MEITSTWRGQTLAQRGAIVIQLCCAVIGHFQQICSNLAQQLMLMERCLQNGDKYIPYELKYCALTKP